MDKKVVLALGYFDGVHLGHRKVILTAKKLAQDFASKLLVLTFKGDLKKAVKGKSNGSIYTYKEKEKVLYSLGADMVYGLSVSKTFLSKGKLWFLNYLNKKFNVLGYVCGTDYKFGKNGGDANYLKNYASKNGQTAVIVNPVLNNGEKVSSSLVKILLQNGEIERANSLLEKDYFMSGKVVRERSVGKRLGFPTANLMVSPCKLALKRGVYAGYAIINNKKYKAVINFGGRPTFDILNESIEAHFIDFNGNLYGKTIDLYFTKYLREIEKFSSQKSLSEKIRQDVLMVKTYD